MKNILIGLLFLPLFVRSQEMKINKNSKDYWDKALQQSMCCDSVFNVTGWLDSGNNENVDLRDPYLQFAIFKSSREGFSIEFNGRGSGNKYETISDLDSVEFEFENHEKIKFSSQSGGIQTLGFSSNRRYPNGASFNSKIQLNARDLKILIAKPIYKLYFMSSKNESIHGEFMVQPKYKNDIVNCIKALALL